MENKKRFYLKRRLTEDERNRLWSLGEKGIITELFQRRVYPHGQLYSHVLGQIDDDNYGISGIENYFDRELRDNKRIKDQSKADMETRNLQTLLAKWANSKFYKTLDKEIKSG